MSSETTTRAWARRPLIAGFLKVVVFVVPIILSMAFITVATRVVARPDTWVATAAWFLVLTAGATLVIVRAAKVMRRVLPVATLFNISLVFPDQAPSRFSVAMRRNTVRQLQRSVDDGTLDEQTPQEAAEHLLRLAAALNDHDRLTRGHTERVRAYSLMIGEELGLPEDELAKLHWAGLIHDVGKLEVPAEILTKDGKPTDEEWRILRSHPARGGELVDPLRPWLGQWADAASQHHEWFDGTGYPNGLAGNEISLSGRIVSVADAFDVITSARSYKPPHSPEFGREELTKGAGTQFDPEIVRAFLNIGIGKLRFVMGPLSWLGNLGALGQSTAVPAVTSAATAAATVVASTALGLIPATAVLEPELAAPRPIERAVDEPTTTTTTTTTIVETTTTTTTTVPFEGVDLVLEAVAGAPATVDVAGAYPGEEVVVTILEPPTEGILVIDENGVAIFLAPPEFAGTVNAEVRVCRADGDCVDATIEIIVSPWDGSPVPMDDTAATVEDVSVTVDVTANDASLDGSPLTVTAIERVGGWSGDSASIVANRVVYVPAPNASGAVELAYTVENDTERTADGTISIDVAAVNDAPTFAGAGDVIVNEDSGPYSAIWASAISAGPTNESSQSVSFTVSVDDPSLFSGAVALDGNGRLTFTPRAETVGSSLVRVTLRDNGGTADGGDDSSAEVRFRIKIGDVNDPPDPGDDQIETPEDTQITFDVLTNDTDIDGDPITFVSYSGDGGSLGVLASLGGGDFTFKPALNATGSTTFTYEVSDGAGGSGSATVTLTVTPVNDAPVASDDGYSGDEDDSIVVAAPGLLGNDTDVDSATLTVQTSPVSGPSNGTLSLSSNGSFTYTPDPGWDGTDSFVYRTVDDGGLTDTATVTLQIDPVITSLQLYFGDAGSSASDYDLVSSPPAAANPEPDVDGDGDDGLRIDKTDKGLLEADGDKYQTWSYTVPSGGLDLQGTATVQLWSALKDFDDEKDVHAYVWLLDCAGSSCTTIASADRFEAEWVPEGGTWVYDELTFASIDYTIAAGRELRLRLQFDHEDMWVAMSGGRPSGLFLNLG